MRTGFHKNPYIWNTIAGVINALQAVILGMIITRTNGLTDAGILALAFSLGNLFMNVGNFGVRKFQVTDVKEEYSFAEYFFCRILTVMLMLFVVAIYLVTVGKTRQYTLEKNIAIYMMCIIYASEAVEDVFAGFFQMKDRLDLGGKIFTFRWGIVLLIYAVILYTKHDLFLASICGAVFSVVSLILTLIVAYRPFHEPLGLTKYKHSWGILKACIPLFLSAFLAYYVTSSPKYAIDKYLTSDVQACYGFVSMPVFVIELLNSFLYMPILVSMAKEWEMREYKKFSVRIKKQSLIIIGIAIVCLGGGYILGIPVLSWLYDTDLNEYRGILMLLLVAGMFMAFSAFFTVVLTIIRKQKYTTYGYVVVALLALIFSNRITKEHGVFGVCLFYVGIMALLTLFFAIVCLHSVGNAKRISNS